jgi:UDPglucose--hexose-1-phosphate uridylyltransferase
MKFEVTQKTAVILDPANDMRPRSIPVEVRTDPLTGRTARICHFMRLQWQKPDLAKLVAGTDAACPFCPERVLKVTPCFPADIAPDGRFFRGDHVLFPNLAPYDGLGAVATLGSRHYTPMADIEAGRIAGGILLAMDFYRRVRAIGHPESVYHLLSWNYMPASGSSLIHPHLQVFASSTAPNQLREELTAAEAYFRTHGRTYWDDLVEGEQSEGRRFLGRSGRVAWLANFAPFSVAGDVLAVVDDCRVMLDLTEEDVGAIAQGLTAAMAAYDRMGIYNFNVCFFPGAEPDRFARLHMVFSPRIYYNPVLATPDTTALRTLYNESICVGFPEDIAAAIRPEFRAGPRKEGDR